jgi:DNA primase
MSSITDEVRSRLDIVDVIQEYLQLKQVGTNWKANCPFHNEKTPSFMVSRDKQIWHCFGCGEGGDIFGFVMKIEGVEFPEALRILANKAGVVLVRQDPALINQKTRLLDICELAAKFYHRILIESLEGRVGLDYLKSRGIKEETIESFILGFAPNSWDTLNKFLIQKGYSENEIFLAGLAVKKERGTGFYDRFRGRIIFPIRDVHGAIIGFTARILPQFDDGKMGKYINTPQTMIYNKSQILYGLDKAKSDIKKRDLAVLVEGNMDVITSHEAGVTNVVASSGTALTLEQVKLLKRYSNNLAIAFDTDPAGDKASERGIDVALREGVNIKVVIIPFGKDPDECIRKNPKDWQEAIDKSRSIMEYYFFKTLASTDLNKVEDKKKAAKIILGVITKIPDGVEQTHWLQKLSETLKVSEQILREAIKKQEKTKYEPKEPEAKELKAKTSQERGMDLSRRLVALILKFPKHLKFVINNLEPYFIADSELHDLYKELVIYYTESEELGVLSEEFKQKLDEKGGILAGFVDILLLLAEKEFAEFDDEQVLEEITKIIKYLKKDFIFKEVKRIENEIRSAEKEGDQKEASELLKEFNKLTEELFKLN